MVSFDSILAHLLLIFPKLTINNHFFNYYNNLTYLAAPVSFIIISVDITKK